jgi:hypothetical protein
MRFPASPESKPNWPNPIVFYDNLGSDDSMTIDPECIHNVFDPKMRVFNQPSYIQRYRDYKDLLPDFGKHSRIRKSAGLSSSSDETSSLSKLAFQGSMRIINHQGMPVDYQTGCGHLGASYVGVASVREGKGYKPQGAPLLGRLV